MANRRSMQRESIEEYTAGMISRSYELATVNLLLTTYSTLQLMDLKGIYKQLMTDTNGINFSAFYLPDLPSVVALQQDYCMA